MRDRGEWGGGGITICKLALRNAICKDLQKMKIFQDCKIGERFSGVGSVEVVIIPHFGMGGVRGIS